MATRVDHLLGQNDEPDIFGNQKGLLTVKQLAEILAVSEKTVYAWVGNGHVGLPYIKIGSALRFSPAAIRKWLRDKEFVPAEFRRR